MTGRTNGQNDQLERRQKLDSYNRVTMNVIPQNSRLGGS